MVRPRTPMKGPILMPVKQSIIGVILAGGQSRRMGGQDKFLLEWQGEPLLATIYRRLNKQIDKIVINTNTNQEEMKERLSSLNTHQAIPFIKDAIKDYAGPLAGIHAAMRWAKVQEPHATHILSVASDTPFFPETLCRKLQSEAEASKEDTIILARSGSHVHPVFGLWPISHYAKLEKALVDGVRKVRLFTDHQPMKIITFPLEQINGETIDPFFNINKPEDWQHYQRIAASNTQ